MDFQLPGGRKTTYRVRIYPRPSNTVVVFTDPQNGTALDLAVKDLANRLIHERSLNPQGTIWIEHCVKARHSPWPEFKFLGWQHSYVEIRFNLFTDGRLPRGLRLGDHRTLQLDHYVAEALVDESLPSFEPAAAETKVVTRVTRRQAREHAQLEQDLAKLRPHAADLLENAGQIQRGAKSRAAKILGGILSGHMYHRVNLALKALQESHQARRNK